MPLHFIFECCKCRSNLRNDLWSLAWNHKYADSQYVCPHFDIIIDHESYSGFGLFWSKQITIRVYCKVNNNTKTLIDKTFNRYNTEYENYALFDNIVCHGRISDYTNNYPSCGYMLQNEIEHNEKLEEIEKQKRKIYMKENYKLL